MPHKAERVGSHYATPPLEPPYGEMLAVSFDLSPPGTRMDTTGTKRHLSSPWTTTDAGGSFSHSLPIPHAATARGLAARTRFRAPPVHLVYGSHFLSLSSSFARYPSRLTTILTSILIYSSSCTRDRAARGTRWSL